MAIQHLSLDDLARQNCDLGLDKISSFLAKKLPVDVVHGVVQELQNAEKGLSLSDYTDDEIDRIAAKLGAGNPRLRNDIARGLFRIHDAKDTWSSTVSDCSSQLDKRTTLCGDAQGWCQTDIEKQIREAPRQANDCAIEGGDMELLRDEADPASVCFQPGMNVAAVASVDMRSDEHSKSTLVKQLMCGSTVTVISTGVTEKFLFVQDNSRAEGWVPRYRKKGKPMWEDPENPKQHKPQASDELICVWPYTDDNPGPDKIYLTKSELKQHRIYHRSRPWAYSELWWTLGGGGCSDSD